MESVKTLLLVCTLIAYPFVVGSLLCSCSKKKQGRMMPGKVYIYGCLTCGAWFGMLSFCASYMSWSFGMFEKILALSSLLILGGWAVVAAVSCKYRDGLIRIIKSIVKGWSGWDTLCACAYGVIALLYMSHPFYISDRFSTPEQVLGVLQSGQMEMAGDRFALLYACMCDWFGLGVNRVLFDAVPYAVLLLAFCVMSELSRLCFGEKKHAKACVLFVYTALLLFGNEAYMNPPYGLLHYPYEGMTFVSNVCIPLVLSVFLSGGSELLLLLTGFNAVVAVGLTRGGVILGVEILLLIIRSLIFSLIERRRAR